MATVEKQKAKAEKISSVIHDLLGQTTSGVPILAGRKTATMKQLEAKKKQKKELIQRKLENRRKMERKIPTPETINIEFERQLRRLATKGVVALFNAVAKAKKDGSKATQLLKTSLPSNHYSNHADDAEERSVISDTSSITANNSIIHRSKSTSAAQQSLSRKRPLSAIAEQPNNKPSKKQSSEGWDKDDDDDV
jgi:hypothetical protein